MNIVAIIPARGGSKGIPGKNLKKIEGRSLLRRAIEAAQKASSVTKVVVTSDCPQILAEARSCGAEIVERPAALADDIATSESALLHAMTELENRGSLVDILVFIQCTSPFILPSDIDGVVSQILDEKMDCALTVTPFHGFLWEPSEMGLTPLGHAKDTRPRRQDRSPVFLETGAAYAIKGEIFKRVKHRFYGKVGQHIVPQKRAAEIDEPVDLSVAKTLAETIENNDQNRLPIKSVSALLLDFDGVLTDDLAIVNQDGVEAVTVSRSDGMGLERLRNETDIRVFVVSKETNPVVAARCKKLGIPCLHGVENKVEKIRNWASENKIPMQEIVYVGNDLNDAPVFPLVGLSVTPCDAFDPVRESADLILKNPGGRGAVREICEKLIAQFPS